MHTIHLFVSMLILCNERFWCKISRLMKRPSCYWVLTKRTQKKTNTKSTITNLCNVYWINFHLNVYVFSSRFWSHLVFLSISLVYFAFPVEWKIDMEHKLVMNRIKCLKSPFVNFLFLYWIHLKLPYERVYISGASFFLLVSLVKKRNIFFQWIWMLWDWIQKKNRIRIEISIKECFAQYSATILCPLFSVWFNRPPDD